jgi:hypothetical protein
MDLTFRVGRPGEAGRMPAELVLYTGGHLPLRELKTRLSHRLAASLAWGVRRLGRRRTIAGGFGNPLRVPIKMAWGVRRPSRRRTIAGGVGEAERSERGGVAGGGPKGRANPLRVPMTADTKIFGVCFLILLPLYWAPLFVTKILPGLDLPFHLALADMLGKRGSATSPYAAFYDGSLRLAPYAAHYAMLVVLGKVMNLLAAHKLIMAAYIAGMPLATSSLLAACGRSRIPALLAFPLAYNLTLHYGFITFALSLPVLMLLLAQTVKHLRSEPGQVLRTWLWTAAAAVLLFLCHLQNFLYGLGAALGFAFLAPLTWRRRLLAASTLLPALAAQAYWQFVGSVPAPGGPPKATLAYAWAVVKHRRLMDLGRQTIWQDLWQRILLIPVHALRSFNDLVEVQTCQAILALIAFYLVAGLVSGVLLRKATSTRSGLRMAPATLVAFAGALAAYLTLPHHLSELDLMTFFPRFAVLVVLMAIVLIPAGLGRVRGVLHILLPLPAVVLCAVYGRELIIHYRAFAAETADLMAVMGKVPPGGKAVGSVWDRQSRVMRIESALVGVVDFYPILRPAPGSMVPLAYCGMRHIPCTRKPAGVDLPDAWVPNDIHPAKSVPIFDYFFVRSPPPGANPFGPYRNSMEVLAQSGTWTVYRKMPGAAIPAPPPPPVAPAPAR